jgi:hypothetical protein
MTVRRDDGIICFFKLIFLNRSATFQSSSNLMFLLWKNRPRFKCSRWKCWEKNSDLVVCSQTHWRFDQRVGPYCLFTMDIPFIISENVVFLKCTIVDFCCLYLQLSGCCRLLFFFVSGLPSYLWLSPEKFSYLYVRKQYLCFIFSSELFTYFIQYCIPNFIL